MPCGGHMGIWRPTPKDIFKSRWKRFYKRCYRPRTAGNTVDHPRWHQPLREGTSFRVDDGVPSPWKLHLVQDVRQRPQDMMGKGPFAYTQNLDSFLKPWTKCEVPTARDLILRSLDRGRHGTNDSGLGRVGVTPPGEAGSSQKEELIPNHLHNMLKAAADEADKKEGKSRPAGEPRASSGDEFLTYLTEETRPSAFVVHRLYELCDEWQLVWSGGQNDPRKMSQRSTTSDPNQKHDRGHFPLVDEQASLIDEFGLRDLLKLAHKTSSRRHPKWKEAEYWYKKRHKQYLRRRAMCEAEAKQRLGILKEALPEE